MDIVPIRQGSVADEDTQQPNLGPLLELYEQLAQETSLNYKVVTYNHEPSKLEKSLNKLAKDGYELHTLYDDIAVLCKHTQLKEIK